MRYEKSICQGKYGSWQFAKFCNSYQNTRQQNHSADEHFYFFQLYHKAKTAYPLTSKEALNKSRHASYLHIFRSFGQPLCRLRRHLPPPGGDHILHENSLKYIKYSCVIFIQSWGRHPPDEKSVCAICIPDLISASLTANHQNDALCRTY